MTTLLEAPLLDSPSDAPSVSAFRSECDQLALASTYNSSRPPLPEHVNMLMAAAREDMDESNYAEILYYDDEFESDSSSVVSRVILSDGSVGYFKSFQDNDDEDYFVFLTYETETILGTLNERNAYRLAQVMGPKYARLVPKTTIRTHKGRVGSLQTEVDRRQISPNSITHEENMRAAVFDYVFGSLDRHSENYFCTEEGVFLIDNSFAFVEDNSFRPLNSSNFITAVIDTYQTALDDEAVDALTAARSEIVRWGEVGLAPADRVAAAIERIDLALDGRDLLDVAELPV